MEDNNCIKNQEDYKGECEKKDFEAKSEINRIETERGGVSQEEKERIEKEKKCGCGCNDK